MNFSTSKELLKLVAHNSQLTAALRFGHVSDHNQSVYSAELTEIRRALTLFDPGVTS
jgi:hypothetical protein